MGTSTDEPDDYRALMRQWSRAPWYRRFSVGMGVQGKLVLAFMLMLTLALGTSLSIYVHQTRTVFWNVMGEHAIEVAHTLGMASERQLARRDVGDLDRIARRILRNSAVAAIGFYDAQGVLLSVASADPDIDPLNMQFMGGWKLDTAQLLKVRRGQTPALGDFAYATVPVIQIAEPNAARARSDTPNSRFVGYVTVATTQTDDEAHLSTIRLMLVVVCVFVVLLSLPLVSMLVHRIFLPIRELVHATDRIAAGDLTARVAVHRPDLIGTLARSFNEMVIRVKRHQDDLAAANGRLEEANTQLATANLQLAIANRDLEERVRQRTVELEVANRRLSSEIAEKEEFLRAISHDLNAPLRNIAGMTAMLLTKHKDKFDEDVVHRLGRIQKNVEIETDLIGELLELSRIKTRRHDAERVDPAAIVHDLGDMFENDLRTRGISLLIEGPLPHIQGERARVRQIFQNLIDNAIKYMGDGERREIRVGSVPRDGEAEFYVSDTGEGIEAGELPKVFQVFRRGKSQSVQNIAGKGVGLASVKSIVETYNGTIWVESQLSQGTTFRFTINGQYLADGAMYASRATGGKGLFAAA
ncbi:MAG TPA: ATP-binding protein [Tepidisphaeraceae bacterium]|jgi:signal transduction histidine kinase|nr:ATP-binding protein [Tepidisphaeraceae bacterium]